MVFTRGLILSLFFASRFVLASDLCGIKIEDQRRILKTVSLFRTWKLKEETKIDQDAADSIFTYRAGLDGKEGTQDDQSINTFEKLVELTSCTTAKLIGLYQHSGSNLSGGVSAHSYYALVYSRTTGNVGTSKGKPTQKWAWEEALRECGYTDCFGSVHSRGCLALAIAKNGQGVIAYGKNANSAYLAVIEGCYKLGYTYCRFEESVCEN